MSRPRWSVPSQCSWPGRASVWPASVAMGSYCWSWFAKNAVSTIASITTPPAAPSGFLRQKRASRATRPACRGSGVAATAWAVALAGSIAIAHPRVQEAIEEVYGQVGEDDDGGDEHDQVLDDRIIARQDGLDQIIGYPRQVEHPLGDDQPADQERELDADDGDHRQHGVLERVAPEHDPAALAFGPRRADVVLPQHLEQRRAGEARDQRGGSIAHRQGG